MEDTSAADIAATLEQVGARLKRLRTQHRLTLTGVAKATGISKSTMSRLETGQRRPILELLLVLSHAYRVPLDHLVAAPEEGDPRIQLKSGRGPLTRRFTLRVRRSLLSGASEGDVVAHGLELVKCPVLGAFGVQAGEEVRTGIVVEVVVG